MTPVPKYYLSLTPLIFMMFFAAGAISLNAQSPNTGWVVQDTTMLPRSYNNGTVKATNAVNFQAMDCADSLHCIAAGVVVNAYSIVRGTTDGGKRWATLLIDSAIGNGRLNTIRYRGVAYPSSGVCVVIGDSGYIYRTSDQGRTWGTIASGTSNNLLNITMFDAKSGVIVGGLKTFLVTNDSGKSWQNGQLPAQLLSPQDQWGHIESPSPGLWFATMGWHGLNGFYRSEDAGAHWAFCDTAQPNASRFTMPSPTRRIAVGYSTISNLLAWDVICKATDVCGSWKQVVHDTMGTPIFGLNGVRFSDSLYGIALGFGIKVLRTTDGGDTWQPLPLPKELYENDNAVAFAIPRGSRKIWIASSTTGRIIQYNPALLGVHDQGSDRNITFSVTPNVMTDKGSIHLRLPGHGQIQVSILNKVGQRVMALPDPGPGGQQSVTIPLDVSGLASGLYFVQVAFSSQRKVCPFIVYR